MAEKKTENKGLWDTISNTDPKTALQGVWDTVTDLRPWSSDTSKPLPTGQRRTVPAPELSASNAAKNVALNLVDPRQWYRTFKNTITAIPSLFNGEAVSSITGAYVGKQIAERRAQKLDVSPNWYRNNILLPRDRKNYTDKQINELIKDSTAKWNVLSNNFSYVDPKTRQRTVDWNAINHRLVENPADIVLMFTGVGEVAAAGRLAKLAKVGRIGEAADVLSDAGKIAKKVQTASRLGSIAADPLTALAVTGGTKAAVRALDIAQRTRSNPVTSILDPNYVTAFEKYKSDTVNDLVANYGYSTKQANDWIKQNKDSMFYDFNAENGGRFSNPYNRETTEMFVAQGKDPSAYGAPSIYSRVNQNFNRSGGPSAPALRQVTLEAGQVASPRRSATTLQAPPAIVAKNDKNWIANQQANLTGQLNDRISANYPGQQFDFEAMARPTDPIPGSTMGDFVYRPDGGWHSTSGNRAGPSLQPILTEQFRMQNPTPNISAADLDFVRRNRAASADLGQANSAMLPPEQKGFWDTAYGIGQNLTNPIFSGISTTFMTGSPHLGLAAGAVTGAKDLYRGYKGARAYADEFSGNPFVYNPNNPFLKNDALLPRSLVQGASAVVPNPIQVQPEPPQQRQAPRPVAPAPAVVESREAIKLPELRQENQTPAPMQSGPLTPQRYDLSGYGINQEEPEPQKMDLSEFGIQPRRHGGRIAYKKGGAVRSGVEPLVQGLMARYKTVKRSQDSGTKPLLQQPDQAIVKALGVAQKAI